MLWRRKRRPASVAHTPRVSVLKPLCGAGPETLECLRSFCRQDYPHYQLLFGVADEHDPVIALIEALRAEFPAQRIDLVVDRAQHGSNRKVSNLINMMSRVEHEYLVLADSDVRVTPDYLRRVIAPLENATVGIATCAYRAVPLTGLWSTLGAMFINDWFIPSVKVAAMSGSRAFAFGATIALRRSALAAIGGFQTIANQLADDYRIGELTRSLGLATVLSDLEVDVLVHEAGFKSLIDHELRWLRTIRSVRPLGYGFSFVTFSVPVALAGVIMSAASLPTLALFAAAFLARSGLHWMVKPPKSHALQLFLVPVRDTLNLVLWASSFLTRRVRWRDASYFIQSDGSVLQSARVRS